MGAESITFPTRRSMLAASPPLVSVVTPMYNEASCLAECIESVLAQTYQNWEYTIVDNCSTDESLEIAREYGAHDKRIRIWQNQQFLDALPNYNVALRQVSAASKYCKVVLADDWIFPECLERMVDVAERQPSVGIVGSYSLEGQAVTCSGLPYPSTLISGREACRLHVLDRVHAFGSPTSILYRADLVRGRDPFYDEANIHADTDVCFALLKTADFGFVHQVLTYTRIRPGSRNTRASKMQTCLGSMLHDLVTHGPDFLTGEELEICLKRHLSEYYGFLSKSVLMRRDAEFWDYHKKHLVGAGVGFSRVRLATAMIATLCDAMLNPKHSMLKLMKRMNNRPIPNNGE